jgi:hypothetical protein
MKQELVSQDAKLKGWIRLDHFDSKGELMETVETPNALMNLGFTEVAGLFCSDQAGSHTAFDYIAVGTGTTVATATQTALDLKANSINLNKTYIGLDNVNNTSDLNKPVSTAQVTAPATLDTLKELATALGNDANFSTTITNLISTKLSKNNPFFTNTLKMMKIHSQLII